MSKILVVPEFVGQWFSVNGANKKRLNANIKAVLSNESFKNEPIYKWIFNNPESINILFEMLDGYEIEPSKIYQVTFLEGRHVLCRRSANGHLPYNWTILWVYSNEYKELKEKNSRVDYFTESEIRSLDEGFFAFAVEVQ